MKLKDVWEARNAFVRFINLDILPGVAYELFPHAKPIRTELEWIDENRIKIVRRAAGIEGNGIVLLDPESDAAKAADAEFEKFLDVESKLPLIPMKLDDIMKVVKAGEHNSIKPAELMLVEQFFKPTEQAEPKSPA